MTRARHQIERGYHFSPLSEIVVALGEGAALAACPYPKSQDRRASSRPPPAGLRQCKTWNHRSSRRSASCICTVHSVFSLREDALLIEALAKLVASPG